MKLNRNKLDLVLANHSRINSMAELADKMEISRSSMYRYFGRNIRPQTAANIAAALGVPVESIVE